MGTQHKGRKCTRKPGLVLPNSKLCANTCKHPQPRQQNYCPPGCSPPSHPPLALSGEADRSEELAPTVRWVDVRRPHLTLIDPVGQENRGSTCSKLANDHFKEVARKGSSSEQNAHHPCIKGDAGVHNGDGVAVKRRRPLQIHVLQHLISYLTTPPGERMAPLIS